MALNDMTQRRLSAVLLAACSLLSACSVLTSRESPLNEVTKGSPTALEIYRGTDQPRPTAAKPAQSPRQALYASGGVRPVTASDTRDNPYWSPLEPMRQRFARVPNPDLVMVVYPHLAQGRYPVPGYVTTFPMYEEIHYALPGELEGERQAAREAAQSGRTESKESKR